MLQFCEFSHLFNETTDLDQMLNDDSLHLIQRDLVGPPIIKLRCAGRGVVGHLRGVFHLAAILQS